MNQPDKGLDRHPGINRGFSFCTSSPHELATNQAKLTARVVELIGTLDPRAIVFHLGYPKRVEASIREILGIKDVPVVEMRRMQLIRKLLKFWEFHHSPTADLMRSLVVQKTSIGKDGLQIRCNPSFLESKNDFTIPIFDPGCSPDELKKILAIDKKYRIPFDDTVWSRVGSVNSPQFSLIRNAREPDGLYRALPVEKYYTQSHELPKFLNFRSYVIVQCFLTWLDEKFTLDSELSVTLFPERQSRIEDHYIVHAAQTLRQPFMIHYEEMSIPLNRWMPAAGPREELIVPLKVRRS